MHFWIRLQVGTSYISEASIQQPSQHGPFPQDMATSFHTILTLPSIMAFLIKLGRLLPWLEEIRDTYAS